MALFWKRKKEDRFVTLGLNTPPSETPERPAAEEAATEATVKTPGATQEPASAATQTLDAVATPPAIEPVPTGGQPAPQPAAESGLTETRKREVVEAPRPSTRSSFSSSVLGLDRSMDE